MTARQKSKTLHKTLQQINQNLVTISTMDIDKHCNDIFCVNTKLRSENFNCSMENSKLRKENFGLIMENSRLQKELNLLNQNPIVRLFCKGREVE